MNSNSEDSATTSTSRKSNLSYSACDFGLVLIQRFLICLTVILGYDLICTPGEIPSMFVFHSLARIFRNFFYLTKAIRKWLAIHYNDGIIPDPPLGRSLRVARSTPRDSRVSAAFGGSLKQSPIERRYSEPAIDYDIATALKEQRNRSLGATPVYRYSDFSNSTDFFGHSSLSFCLLLNGLAQSFIGYIEDPDEEMNRMGTASKNIGKKTNLASDQTEASIGPTTSVIGDTENRRRAMEVVESVLEHDEEQRKAALTADCKGVGSDHFQPLPIPNFDATIDHA